MGQKLLEKQIWRGVGESHHYYEYEGIEETRRKLKEEEVKEQMKTPGPFTPMVSEGLRKMGKWSLPVVDWAWETFQEGCFGT